MEVNVRDEQMDSAGVRSSETDRQEQRWSAYVMSSVDKMETRRETYLTQPSV